MNSGKYVFSGLVEFLPQKEFYKMVKRYNADKWTKRVSCWNQLLLMMFGQLSGCDSLRELVCIVAAHQKKSYHLGFGKGIIARSTLEYANAHRDYRLYEEFAYYMTSLAQSKRIDSEFVLNGQAKDIAMLYKQRWQVELFFRWIKQHLQVKSFWGNTENAVRIQIYVAIITYCLVAIVEHDCKLGRSTFNVLRVLNLSLLDKTPIPDLFKNHEKLDDRYVDDCMQLKLKFEY